MALSNSEKAALDVLFVKIVNDAQNIGCEAMESLFAQHPYTKCYFRHMNVAPGSRDLKAHGERLIHTINDALRHHDNLHNNMQKLRQLHSDKLRLNLETVQLLCPCLVEVIAKRFPEVDKSACEKFLNTVAASLVDD
ncbi:hemoglobin heart muscle subunit alpha-type-like [Leptodactylus fuscus]|uniref:hemoglobin heart muscle subunit alpha-type-like n=1 Tax=Leptodactylus fuscus TaxID=238119 RepID=UPI003F4EE742